MSVIVKKRPILFRGEMVRAILEGRKTQTRRILKLRDSDFHPNDYEDPSVHCPYGQPGDRLWVRETWATTEQSGVHAADAEYVYKATDPDWDTMEGWRWRPSIFMPRAASRLELEIVKVRVEQLQEIEVNDIRAEGISCPLHDFASGFCVGECPDLRGRWAHGWNKINEKRGFGWEANPWLWVLNFTIVKEPING